MGFHHSEWAAWHPARLREQLRGYLADWQTLLGDDSAKSRGLLDLALSDRIRFTPDAAHRRYELAIPIAFDRLLTAVVPELAGVQEMVTSPTGFEPVFQP